MSLVITLLKPGVFSQTVLQCKINVGQICFLWTVYCHLSYFFIVLDFSSRNTEILSSTMIINGHLCSVFFILAASLLAETRIRKKIFLLYACTYLTFLYYSLIIIISFLVFLSFLFLGFCSWWCLVMPPKQMHGAFECVVNSLSIILNQHGCLKTTWKEVINRWK